jgi:hypothetical protein
LCMSLTPEEMPNWAEKIRNIKILDAYDLFNRGQYTQAFEYFLSENVLFFFSFLVLVCVIVDIISYRLFSFVRLIHWKWLVFTNFFLHVWLENINIPSELMIWVYLYFHHPSLIHQNIIIPIINIIIVLNTLKNVILQKENIHHENVVIWCLEGAALNNALQALSLYLAQKRQDLKLVTLPPAPQQSWDTTTVHPPLTSSLSLFPLCCLYLPHRREFFNLHFSSS